MFHAPDDYRIIHGPLGSKAGSGNNGAFEFKIPEVLGQQMSIVKMFAIASDGMGWEHVSVSLPHRTPTWEEMHYVKSLFWDPEDVVMQLHPADSKYVNVHPYCLHLWRPIGQTIPTPPLFMVG